MNTGVAIVHLMLACLLACWLAGMALMAGEDAAIMSLFTRIFMLMMKMLLMMMVVMVMMIMMMTMMVMVMLRVMSW